MSINQTFYATEVDQLRKVLELASKVDPLFVAKAAIYCRDKGLMKDMPAFLTAFLAVIDVRLLASVFPRVIDNGKMLRNFVQISAEIIPFSDHVVELPRRLNPLDTVMTNAQYLASLPSGGTACSAALRHLNDREAHGDLVIFVSDNMSWADFARTTPSTSASSRVGVATPATVMAEEWELFRKRNPNAKLVLIDIQPYGSTQMHERADVLNVGGFSDSVFDVIALFAKGELGADRWISQIKGVSLT